MRRTEIELLDRDLDDDDPPPTAPAFGLPIPERTLDEGELGIRALYERPEVILRAMRWPRVA